VGKVLLLTDYRDGLGSALNLRLKKLVQALILWIVKARCVPQIQELLPFWFGQIGQFGEPPVGIRDDAGQQGLVVAQHTLNSALIEQVGVIFQQTTQPLLCFCQAESEIHPGSSTVQRKRLRGESWQ